MEGTDTDPRDPNGKIEKLKRTNSAMTKLGFTVLLNPGARNYMDAVKNDYVGWKILAHNPLNFAEVSGKGFSVNSGAETFISIRSQVNEIDIFKIHFLFILILFLLIPKILIGNSEYRSSF